MSTNAAWWLFASTMMNAPLVTWIRRGLLVLLAVVPFHAFLALSFGHFFGHEPWWAAWKEALLLILAVSTTAVAYRQPELRSRLMTPFAYAVVSFTAVAFLISALMYPGLSLLAYGAKTDLEFLLAALVALIVSDHSFVRTAVRVLLISSGVVAIFAIMQAAVLPANFLTHFGYTFAPGQTAPYETVFVGHTLHNRFGSTLGGPNQLGTFLILPLVLSVIFGLRRRWWWLLSLILVPALFISYSRGAWIGAVLAIIMAIVVVAPARLRYWVVGAAGVLVVAVGLLVLLAPAGNVVSQYFHHPAADNSVNNSDSQHLSSVKNGVDLVLSSPLGYGLGTAGPATFHAGTPNIIENNYLQIGYETGLIGLAIFVVIVALMASTLIGHKSLASVAVASAIMGISVTALVLPAWTDSSTALTVWLLGGAAFGARHE